MQCLSSKTFPRRCDNTCHLMMNWSIGEYGLTLASKNNTGAYWCSVNENFSNYRYPMRIFKPVRCMTVVFELLVITQCLFIPQISLPVVKQVSSKFLTWHSSLILNYFIARCTCAKALQLLNSLKVKKRSLSTRRETGSEKDLVSRNEFHDLFLPKLLLSKPYTTTKWQFWNYFVPKGWQNMRNYFGFQKASLLTTRSFSINQCFLFCFNESEIKILAGHKVKSCSSFSNHTERLVKPLL